MIYLWLVRAGVTGSLPSVKRLEMFVMFIFIFVRQTDGEYFKRQSVTLKFTQQTKLYKS